MVTWCAEKYAWIIEKLKITVGAKDRGRRGVQHQKMVHFRINMKRFRSGENDYNWFAYALLSAASIALMATCVRMASVELPRSEIVFFRNFISLMLLFPFATRRRLPLRTTKLGLHLFRAIFGVVAMYLYFYAIAHLPLADAVLLNYTSPLFISFFAVILLGEQLNKNRKLSIVLGFIGVCCLFHPSSAVASIAGLLGLLSGVSAGLAQVSIRKLSATEPGLLIVIMFAFFGSIFTLVPMLFDFILPDAGGWLALIGVGFFGNLGQISMTRAYTLAPASQVAPLGYFGLIFAGLIGFLFWNETPDYWMLLGTIFICIAGTLVAREHVVPGPARL